MIQLISYVLHLKGTVLLDLTWRAAFEPVESEGDNMVVAPLPLTWRAVAVPPHSPIETPGRARQP